MCGLYKNFKDNYEDYAKEMFKHRLSVDLQPTFSDIDRDITLQKLADEESISKPPKIIYLRKNKKSKSKSKRKICKCKQ